MKKGHETRIWHEDKSVILDCIIGDNCTLHAPIWVGNNVIIGNDCKIQAFCFLPEGVELGNNVFLGPNVTFTNDKHPPSGGKWWFETIIKDGARIGAGALIITGITIGEKSFIAAGAVVTKDVDPGVTVMGIPARVRRLEE